jgi:hypothetical protein
MVSQDGVIFYKPDDRIPGTTKTWRDLVLEQNEPDLVPAYKLYSHVIYRDLYHVFGNRFYILSAGWGIIRADFKIPAYDITYSPNAPNYAIRTDDIGWNDINHLQEDSGKFDSNTEIILFASSYYAPHFCYMAQSIPYNKIVLKYTSNKSENGRVRQVQNCSWTNYYTTQKTNWYYEAAQRFTENYANKIK